MPQLEKQVNHWLPPVKDDIAFQKIFPNEAVRLVGKVMCPFNMHILCQAG
jgi:hypothetical protein